MNDTKNKQYIKQKNQERLERMKSSIERGKRLDESSLWLMGGPRKTLARRQGLLHAFTGKDKGIIRRFQIKYTDKDLLGIAALGDGYRRQAVLDALSDLCDPDPVSSIEEAKERADFDHGEIEGNERDLAESMIGILRPPTRGLWSFL